MLTRTKVRENQKRTKYTPSTNIESCKLPANKKKKKKKQRLRQKSR